ncbi:hypothetical protein PTSG_01669 [Salpingoeca rosetta]|uniref:Uncharacterized protein n=1 Tax=Salpingoeca rosetta (strain ATCC 50818 / BSB-021) TaxID=946362 RepID=F2TYL7_SALR5|nr:uncharacterized protein PTSG_01669 [Salpingoeca rosetta]EGD78691.1 hypothetical protein PTSG_01669 [Salpingoeca rosetta]|eukprot:XP_004997648.1 hypothetical protein PTSG_01669 [Salpingoeca rosetta]
MVEAVTPALTAYHAMVKKWFDSKNAKIRQQIKLDVQDIIKQIRSLEAEPVDSAEWTELLESIDML